MPVALHGLQHRAEISEECASLEAAIALAHDWQDPYQEVNGCSFAAPTHIVDANGAVLLDTAALDAAISEYAQRVNP